MSGLVPKWARPATKLGLEISLEQLVLLSEVEESATSAINTAWRERVMELRKRIEELPE